MSTLYVNNLYPQTGSQVSLIGNLSASINISASKFYGDGGGITGVTGEWDGTIVGSMSGSSTLEVVGATYLGSTLGVTGAVTAASYSGSSTLQTVGATTLGSTLAVSGNVGVATSPSAPLHVYKEAASQDSNPLELLRLESQDEGVDMNAGHGPAITFYVGETGGSDHGGTVAVVREAAGDADSAAAMVFHTAVDDTTPAERMRITSTGLVGIGTTDPSDTFTVVGGISGSSTLQVAGNTIVTGDLSVSGTLNAPGDHVVGSLSASSTLQAVGNTILGGTLNVTGATSVKGNITSTNGHISTDNGNISVGGAGTWTKGPGGGIAVSGYMSGSSTLQTVGKAYFGHNVYITGGVACKQLVSGSTLAGRLSSSYKTAEVDPSSRVLTTDESGHVFFLNTDNKILTLPTPDKAGTYFKFVNGDQMGFNNNNSGIVTAAEADGISGMITATDGNAVSASFGGGPTKRRISFTTGSKKGDWFEVTATGTEWYANGQCFSGSLLPATHAGIIFEP
jgi:hypothetical protein